MDIVLKLIHNFNINQTFFVMMGIFVGSYVVLHFISLGRVSESLVERDHRIEGREIEITKLRHELVTIQEKLKSEMARARLDAQTVYLEFRTRAQEDQRNLITQARQRAATEIQSVRVKIADVLRGEMTKLDGEVPRLAEMIVDRILGVHTKPASDASSLETEV